MEDTRPALLMRSSSLHGLSSPGLHTCREQSLRERYGSTSGYCCRIEIGLRTGCRLDDGHTMPAVGCVIRSLKPQNISRCGAAMRERSGTYSRVQVTGFTTWCTLQTQFQIGGTGSICIAVHNPRLRRKHPSRHTLLGIFERNGTEGSLRMLRWRQEPWGVFGCSSEQ